MARESMACDISPSVTANASRLSTRRRGCCSAMKAAMTIAMPQSGENARREKNAKTTAPARLPPKSQE